MQFLGIGQVARERTPVRACIDGRFRARGVVTTCDWENDGAGGQEPGRQSATDASGRPGDEYDLAFYGTRIQVGHDASILLTVRRLRVAQKRVLPRVRPCGTPYGEIGDSPVLARRAERHLGACSGDMAGEPLPTSLAVPKGVERLSAQAAQVAEAMRIEAHTDGQIP